MASEATSDSTDRYEIHSFTYFESRSRVLNGEYTFKVLCLYLSLSVSFSLSISLFPLSPPPPFFIQLNFAFGYACSHITSVERLLEALKPHTAQDETAGNEVLAQIMCWDSQLRGFFLLALSSALLHPIQSYLILCNPLLIAPSMPVLLYFQFSNLHFSVSSIFLFFLTFLHVTY